MEDPVERFVRILSVSLVREYLSRKGLDKTLHYMDTELPGRPESLNSTLLAKELNIQFIMQKNNERLKPYKTILEVIINEIILNNNLEEQSSFKIDLQLINNNRTTLDEIQKKTTPVIPQWSSVNRTFTTESIQELNLTHHNKFGLQMADTLGVSKLVKINYRHLIAKKIHHDGLADLDLFLTSLSSKGRARNCEKNISEASLKEYEETIKETMEYNRTHPRVYNPRKVDETPLKVKEGILLDSINTSIDSSSYNNKNRLGPNKENTFQCLKRSRSTSSMSSTTTSSPSLSTQLSQDCDNPLRSKSRSINLPHQIHVDRDSESQQSEAQQKSSKEDEVVKVLTAEENSSVNFVNDHTMEDKLIEKEDTHQNSISKSSALNSEGTIFVENKSLESSSFQSVDTSTSSEKSHLERENEISLGKSVINRLTNNSNISCGDSLGNITKSQINSQIFVDKEGDEFKYLELETVLQLKKILVQSPLNSFSNQWMCQSFIFNTNPKLQYGFVQNKGGACGVLATVQGFLLKALLFNSSTAAANTDPLRPTLQEVRSALVQALCDILWQAGQSQQAVLVCLTEESHLEDSDLYRVDGFTEFLCYKRFTSLQDLHASVDTHLSMFTAREGKGCLLFIISAFLSRGINSVLEDMDDDACDFISSNGTCALELVTLLLTGKAVSNVFDNNIQLDSCLLKGVTKRSDIGFLSLYEHYNSCQVGSNLKTPRYPIWLVNSGNHFSVIFSARKQLVSDWRAEKQFQLHHYDGMIGYNDDIILQIDTTGLHLTMGKEDDNVPTLDLCVRTKWKDAAIKWTTNTNN